MGRIINHSNPTTGLPPRPERKDELTGLTIPVELYVWRTPTGRAPHWYLPKTHLEVWRRELQLVVKTEPSKPEPTSIPVPEPTPVVVPETKPEPVIPSTPTVEPTPVVPEPVILPTPTPEPTTTPVEHGHDFSLVEKGIVGVLHLLTLYGFTMWLAGVAPLFVAVPAGVIVVGSTYLLLEGAFGHAPLRRWIALIAFGFVGVIGSGATWTHDLGGEGASTALATESYADLMVEALRPSVDAARESDQLAKAAEGKCSDEVTHRGGRGPIARQLCDEARSLRATADADLTKRDELQSVVVDTTGMESDEIHAHAVELATVAGLQAPPRTDYIEPELIIPLLRLSEGDPSAVVGHGLALGIDLIGIFVLGSALYRRRRS